VAEPKSSLTVRPAVVDDAASIAAIGKVGFRAVHDNVVGPVVAAWIVERMYSTEALTECITFCAQADDAHFLVAEEDGQVVGFVHYDSQAAEPELHRIYIDPSRKRSGIGSRLLHELHARLQPGTSYVLLVAEENTAARAFYERHGFVFESRVIGKEYYAQTMGIDDEPTQDGYEDRALLFRFTLPS
jgi:GNAT superfamily N-acetyltransferase